MILSDRELSTLFDTLKNFDMSTESLIDLKDISVGCHRDMIAFKKGMTSILKTRLEHEEDSRKVPSFVAVDSVNEQTIIVDDELIYGICFGNNDITIKFIRQLQNIPKDCKLNVIIETSLTDVNFVVMDACTMIVNLIRNVPAVRIYNFGAQASIVDLMIARCCDEILVSDFASISITKADNGAGISRYLVPVYRYLVRSTYNYWIEKGLFTPEEITGIFASEADNSILLLSDEIKRRIAKNKE